MESEDPDHVLMNVLRRKGRDRILCAIKSIGTPQYGTLQLFKLLEGYRQMFGILLDDFELYRWFGLKEIADVVDLVLADIVAFQCPVKRDVSMLIVITNVNSLTPPRPEQLSLNLNRGQLHLPISKAAAPGLQQNPYRRYLDASKPPSLKQYNSSESRSSRQVPQFIKKDFAQKKNATTPTLFTGVKMGNRFTTRLGPQQPNPPPTQNSEAVDATIKAMSTSLSALALVPDPPVPAKNEPTSKPEPLQRTTDTSTKPLAELKPLSSTMSSARAEAVVVQIASRQNQELNSITVTDPTVIRIRSRSPAKTSIVSEEVVPFPKKKTAYTGSAHIGDKGYTDNSSSASSTLPSVPTPSAQAAHKELSLSALSLSTHNTLDGSSARTSPLFELDPVALSTPKPIQVISPRVLNKPNKRLALTLGPAPDPPTAFKNDRFRELSKRQSVDEDVYTTSDSD
uniref:RUN domain-containing protein n=1 Tax=Panagrellus redivivus TaxID=6233 RepID=A0A7E4WA93_PANRE